MGRVGLCFHLVVLAGLSCLTVALGQTLPLHTSSRWILDATNARVKFRCVNWAGHLETNTPEGLDKQPIEYITSWIHAQGFNCVRLTYSIDHALNPNVLVSDAFAAGATAAGVSAQAMTNTYNNAVGKNPFLASATTQDVFGAIVDSLWSKGVMTILDNHVSKASWCCSVTDGNGWWNTASGYNDLNSRYFVTSDWLNGLQAMATWAQSHPGVVAMSLRNELRQFLLQDLTANNDWYTYVSQGAVRVHQTNPDVLIIIGGISSATDLSMLKTANLDTSAWAGKHVWEFHAYPDTTTFPATQVFGSCDLVNAEYGALDGFVLQQGASYTAPLILSEFGVAMTGGPNQGLSDRDHDYLDCLVKYAISNDIDWAIWPLQGTYYVRQGVVGWEETWGVISDDWSGWRNPQFPPMLGAMWNVTQGP